MMLSAFDSMLSQTLCYVTFFCSCGVTACQPSHSRTAAACCRLPPHLTACHRTVTQCFLLPATALLWVTSLVLWPQGPLNSAFVSSRPGQDRGIGPPSKGRGAAARLRRHTDLPRAGRLHRGGRAQRQQRHGNVLMDAAHERLRGSNTAVFFATNTHG